MSLSNDATTIPRTEPDRGVQAQARRASGAPPINGVSAGIIPHTAFANRRWLFADDTLWYYHAPKLGRAAPVDEELLVRTLDPLVIDLVMLLRRRGAVTTPSCQGHFYGVEHYGAVWRKLRADRDRAREGGLLLQDGESGETFCLLDPTYELPWEGFSSFLQEARRHQTMGYLGFGGLPASHWRGLRAVVPPAHAAVELGPVGAGGFSVCASHAEAQGRAWRELAQAVARSFDRTRTG